MGARVGTWDWQAEKDELFRKYLEKAALVPRPERPKPAKVSKRVCRKDTIEQLLAAHRARGDGGEVSLRLLRARCDACRRCKMAPRSI